MLLALCKLVGWLTRRYVPAKTKRMLLLMGVAAKVRPIDNNDSKETNEYLRDINALFKLASTQDSLRFAIEVGQILWSDLKYKFSSTTEDFDKLTKEILSLCPESLNYASREEMYEEIKNTLQFAHSYAQKTQA